MIYWFSGTGNSRYAAEVLARVTGDPAVSLNKLMRAQSAAPLPSDGPYVFVFPIYAWKAPRVVLDFIRSHELTGAKQAYFLATAGSSVGTAEADVRQLCQEKGLEFRGLGSVAMPNNYLILGKVTPPEEAKARVLAARPVIESYGARIKAGESIVPTPAMKKGKVQAALFNGGLYKSMDGRKFRFTADCDGCGRCAQNCPLNTITMKDGHPVWAERCTQCLSCLNECPRQAIEYGQKTVGKERYSFARLGIRPE